MSLEEVAPIAAMLRARRGQPAPPIEMRRAGFEAQMAGQPLPSDFVAERVEIAPGFSGLLCRTEASGDGVIAWLHGGAFVLGSADSYRPFAARLAQACGAQVLLPDYRLAPENRFPAALDDAVATLAWLAGRAGPTAIGGDSAGANLALAALQARLGDGLAMPDALWLVSAYLDLTHSGSTVATHAARDPFVDAATMEPTAAVYLDGADPSDPRASPLFGVVEGLPPTLLQVGSEEVLLADSTRLRDRIEAVGGTAMFQEWAGMIHVWPIFAHAVEEGCWAIMQGGNFVRGAWSQGD